MYALKQKSSVSKNESFAEYIKKFLSEEWYENDGESSSERAYVGFQTGFAFIMLIIKELSTMEKSSVLINSLQHLYKILKDINKGSLIHEKDKRMTMAMDVHLNEAREFLLELIRAQDSSKKVTLLHPSVLANQENAKKITLLAHKILLLIGVARSSVEDLLVLCSVLQESKIQVDLRPELRKLRDMDPSSSIANEKDTFNPGEINYIKEEDDEEKLILLAHSITAKITSGSGYSSSTELCW